MSFDPYGELVKKIKLLDTAMAEINKRGIEYAEAERAYRVLLRQEILLARAEGIPVTLINDICRGIESVADAKQKRDACEAKYRAAIEALNVYKLQAKLYEAQIAREYSMGSSV